MKRARFSIVLTAALLSLNPVQASTFTALTLTQQAKKAQVIVRVTVGAPTTTQTGSGPTAVSWVNYPLTVTETIAGDVASLPVREGKPTLMFLAGLQNVPTLNSGQDVFLLLYTGTQDSPLVGFNQGAYPVVNGRVTRWNEAAAFGTEAPTPTVTPIPATSPTTKTTTNTGTSAATPSTPAGTAAPATTPPVDGATAAVSNPVTPSPTPTTGTATAPATTATGTTTPPAAAATPVNPAPASSTASSATATPVTLAIPPTPSTPAATVTPTPAANPNAFERDPAKFRDQLRAARNTP
ncbi:hypothetical protein [Deinococcus sp. QL22]|uniref:hypothetical protein n=1 Tax=Deinococcus sp. QL22 TaxID=2939437 RepID=UPI002017D400|nr:hypothetical protein [Deinococcus sp. QL22]UQN05933.1 hypothetical protein M1R55_13850 [Deinococcus sp. QL22]